MSELTTRFIDDTYAEYYNTGKHELAQIYLKYEADKVIAELKKACNDKDNWCLHTLKRERRRKYKQCVAMAEWCNSEMGREPFACFRPRGTKELWREGHNYWAKWRKIWFELAQKFKEAK